MRLLKIFGFTSKRPQSGELDSSDKGPSDADQQQARKDAQATPVREPSADSTASDLVTVPSEAIRQATEQDEPEGTNREPYVPPPPLPTPPSGPASAEMTEPLAVIKRRHEEFAARKAAMEAQSRPVPPDWDAQVVRSVRGVSFRVDDVEPATEAIICELVADRLKEHYEDRLLIPTGEHPVIAPDLRAMRALHLTERPKRRRTLGLEFHALLEAVHIAFSEHRPLVLSPDAIWLVIAQGFSDHVKENAAALKASFVRQQCQKSLNVRASSFTRTGFAGAIADISTLIRQETNAVVHDALVCNFSTTTAEIRTASEIVLMDTFSKYFKYGVTICGIPRITLEGTREDWETMRARLEVLATYELEWWVERLRPIFDEFVLAAEGRPTPHFWRAIYKPKEAYGGDVITGWIADLFPYLGPESRKMRNPLLNKKRHNWALKAEEGMRPSPAGVGLSTVPSGLCKVALDVSGIDADLVAGFIGVRQSADDFALAPVIDWFVVKPETKRTARDLR